MIDLLKDRHLQFVRGEWDFSPYVRVQSNEPFTIFESDYEPGLVAWPSLWQERDGLLRLTFAEVQGDAHDWPPRYDFGARHRVVIRYFESADAGKTWCDSGWTEDNDPLWETNSDPHCIRVLPRADGSLLRICHRGDARINHLSRPQVYDESLENAGVFPFRAGEVEAHTDTHPQFFTVQESFDSGRNWKTIFSRALAQAPDLKNIAQSPDASLMLGFDWWATGSRILENGNIVWMGRIAERDEANGLLRPVLAVAESSDGGSTWCEPVPLLRERGLFHSTMLTEEVDFVALGENRFLALVRTDAAGHNLQLVLHRHAPGRWSIEQQEYSVVPHSGFPFLLKCADGTILHQGLSGHWSTPDAGRAWNFHPTMECYYGQMVEVEPGRVLAITQVNAGDEAYPNRHDAFLRGCFLSHRQHSQLRQSDGQVEMALALTDVLSTDGHLLAQFQFSGCVGLIARADASLTNFFALVIRCGGGADRFAGTPPSASNLSVSICKVTNGRVQILAQRNCGQNICSENLIEVQFVVRGENLMAAVRVAGGRASYVSVRDASLPTGQWGIFSDLSKVTFRQLQATAQPMKLRDSWKYLK